MDDTIFVWLVLLSGAYLLYAGIFKRGGIYNTEYPKDIKPQIDKSLSIFSTITGIIMVAGSLIEILNVFPEARGILVLGTAGLVLVIWVGYLIYFRKKFGPHIR